MNYLSYEKSNVNVIDLTNSTNSTPSSPNITPSTLISVEKSIYKIKPKSRVTSYESLTKTGHEIQQFEKEQEEENQFLQTQFQSSQTVPTTQIPAPQIEPLRNSLENLQANSSFYVDDDYFRIFNSSPLRNMDDVDIFTPPTCVSQNEDTNPISTIPILSTGHGEWSYSLIDDTEIPFSEEINIQIEKSFKSGKPHVSVELDHFVYYTIFFDSMIMRCDGNDYIYYVKRNVKSSNVIQIPVNRFNTDQSLQISYPMEWESQSNICELKEVLRTSMEFRRIEKLISTTVPANIASIKRIQNQHLWRRYYFERSFVASKNGGNANEMDLFHGTRSTDPVEIYNGEEGFDMRYSKKGRWGMGIYFADAASYSYSFGYYDPETKTKQMLFNRVAIGSAFSCLQGDVNLRTPPAKPKNCYTQSRIPFATDFFDSVVGVINATKIYTVYSNSKAYPSYLISFHV